MNAPQSIAKILGPATAEPRPPKLLDRVRAACRVRHYSIRTEEAYVDWVRRFILFHNKRHPREMGAAEINQFLTHLAVEGHVSASTQNQAFSALLFLYQKVLEVEPGLIEGVIRAKRPERLPVILTREEVRAVLGRLDGVPRLVALLLYGAGLRILDGLRLRIQDVDCARMELLIRHSKGGKDRRTMLPAAAKAELLGHIDRTRALFERDRAAGVGVSLPDALKIKYPEAPFDWSWYDVFPARQRGIDPRAGQRKRHHLHESVIAARGGASGAPGRGGQARDAARLPPCLCHALARRRLRHPHGAGAARSCERRDDNDLHARLEPGWTGRAESAGRPRVRQGMQPEVTRLGCG